MPLLNYTTEVAASKSVAEIHKILAAHNCLSIMSEYEKGEVSALSFRIKGAWGMMSYRMPANVPKVFAALCRHSNRVPPRFQKYEQATRVAWRILKDWIEAQLALIAVEMASMEQVFLPYAQDAEGQTVYEKLSAGGFSGLALPSSQP